MGVIPRALADRLDLTSTSRLQKRGTPKEKAMSGASIPFRPWMEIFIAPGQ